MTLSKLLAEFQRGSASINSSIQQTCWPSTKMPKHEIVFVLSDKLNLQLNKLCMWCAWSHIPTFSEHNSIYNTVNASCRLTFEITYMGKLSK